MQNGLFHSKDSFPLHQCPLVAVLSVQTGQSTVMGGCLAEGGVVIRVHRLLSVAVRGAAARSEFAEILRVDRFVAL